MLPASSSETGDGALPQRLDISGELVKLLNGSTPSTKHVVRRRDTGASSASTGADVKPRVFVMTRRENETEMAQCNSPPQVGAGMAQCKALPPTVQLPRYVSASNLQPSWGASDDNDILEGADLTSKIRSAYGETVRWRRNIFLVPSGATGKEFILEMAKFFQAYADGSILESIAMTAAMPIPSLLLQKPYKKSKAKEHVECLKRRLKAWKEGDFEGLLKEGRAIQNHLTSDGRQAQKED